MARGTMFIPGVPRLPPGASCQRCVRPGGPGKYQRAEARQEKIARCDVFREATSPGFRRGLLVNPSAPHQSPGRKPGDTVCMPPPSQPCRRVCHHQTTLLASQPGRKPGDTVCMPPPSQPCRRVCHHQTTLLASQPGRKPGDTVCMPPPSQPCRRVCHHQTTLLASQPGRKPGDTVCMPPPSQPCPATRHPNQRLNSRRVTQTPRSSPPPRQC